MTIEEDDDGLELEWWACDMCRAKPGSPLLCSGCLHNRTVIDRLLAERRKQVPRRVKKALKHLLRAVHALGGDE